MAKKSRKNTVGDYIKALRATAGLVAPAAHRLGVTRKAVYNMAKNHPSIKEAMDDAREDLLDLATGNVYRAVNDGDLRASYFVLERIGKDRGWVPRSEVELPKKTQRDLEEMTDDELNEHIETLST